MLFSALNSDNIDKELEKFLSIINFDELKGNSVFSNVKAILCQIMELVAKKLSANWNDPRYSREIFDD